jgi:O-antigen/teichoic acid export membrane protein
VLLVLWSLANGYDSALLFGGIGASLALVIQHTLTIPLTAELRLGSLSALELARQGITVAAILTLAALGAGVFPLLAITLLANTLLILPTWWLARSRISLRPSLRWREWPPRRATVVFSLATAVGTLYVYAAQVLTSYVMSDAQRGLFAFSFRVIIVTAGVPGLVVGAALPVLSRAARDDRDRLAYVMQRIFEATLIGGVGVALTLCAGAGFVVSVITHHHGFAGAVPVLEIQSWMLVASFVLGNRSYGLLSLHLHRGILLSNLASLLVSVVLTVAFGKAFGARGAAFATIAGETTLALASLWAIAARRPSTGLSSRSCRWCCSPLASRPSPRSSSTCPHSSGRSSPRSSTRRWCSSAGRCRPSSASSSPPSSAAGLGERQSRTRPRGLLVSDGMGRSAIVPPVMRGPHSRTP